MSKLTITSDPSTRLLKLKPVTVEMVDDTDRHLCALLKRHHGEKVEVRVDGVMVPAELVVEGDGDNVYVQTVDGLTVKAVEGGQNVVEDGFYLTFTQRGGSVEFKR